MTAPVQSIKHIVDVTGALSGAAVSTSDIANVVKDPDNDAAVNQVHYGARISAIFLRIDAVASIQPGGIGNVYMAVLKNPGNELGTIRPDAMGTEKSRKFVIHQEMTMLTNGNATAQVEIPRTIFKGVILLKRYRRFGIKDKLQVLLSHRTGEATQTTNFCLQSIYKEFF